MNGQRRSPSPAYHEDSGEAGQRIDAEGFLTGLLKDGGQEAAEVERGRKAAAISEYSLKKAKIALGIEPYKEGGEFGGKGAKWYWELPQPEEGDGPQDGEQDGEPAPQPGFRVCGGYVMESRRLPFIFTAHAS